MKEGIEPNPGPTSCSTFRKTLSCVSLNTGGAIGVWKALENLLKHDIVALQEICLTKAELRAVQLSAGRKGYRCYHSSGTPTKDVFGNSLPQHGVLTLVRKEIQQKEIDSTSYDDKEGVFQSIVVQIADWIHINTYTPPRNAAAAHEAARAHMDVLKTSGIPSSRPWVWCGDFNHSLNRGPFSTLARTCQGTPIKGLQGTPTRWEGKQTIDHIYSNNIELAQNFRTLKLKISDHVPLSFQLRQAWYEETHRYVFPPRGKWQCPKTLDMDKWTQQLEHAWKESTKVEQLLNCCSQETDIQVDEEWNLFNCALQDIFSTVEGKYGNDNPYKNNSGNKKGDPADTKQITKRICRDPGTMQSRKRINFLGRAEAFRRKCATEPGFAQTKEYQVLFRRLGKRHPHQLNDIVRELSIQENEYRKNLKSHRLTQWKEKMNNDFSSRVTWVKRPSFAGMPAVCKNEQKLFKVSEIMEAIKNHWKQVWDQALDISPLNQADLGLFLKEFLGDECMEHMDGRPLNPELYMAVTQMKKAGACGPDQWRPDEIKALPSCVLDTFWTLTNRWELCGKSPAALHEIRQINIPKMHKIGMDNCISCADLRPISIYSCWWRLYTGTWSKSRILRTWRQNFLAPEIAGGKDQPGAEDLAAQLCDQFNKKGFVGTMDYSQCFDHVCPSHTTMCMKHLGISHNLANVLKFSWEKQKRYICWDQNVDPDPIYTQVGLPQGDGLSPVALACLLQAGLNYVKQGDDTTHHCVYMDDRSWATDTAEQSLVIKDRWTEWSRLVGLKENKGKTQLAACRPTQVQKLAAIAPPEFLKNQAEVLGVAVTSKKKRKPTEKELSRRCEALGIIQRTGLLPISRKERHGTIRAVASSKISYGWVTRKPTKSEVQKYDTAIWRACSEPHKGGTFHKKLLLGISLDGIVGIRQVMRMLTARHRSLPANPPTLFPSEKHAADFLTTHGWILRDTLHWQHPQLRLHLRADRSWDEDDRARAGHSLRESWRLTQWNELVNQRTRHQTADYRGESYCSNRVTLLRKTVASLTGAQRWLMLGAATSPLEYMISFRKERGEQLAPCPFTDCTCGKADWEHIMWSCSFRPVDRMVRPSSGLLRRYGWLIQQEDENLMLSMAQTIELMWNVRIASAEADD